MPEHVLKMSDFAQKVNEIKVFKNRYLLGIDKPSLTLKSTKELSICRLFTLLNNANFNQIQIFCKWNFSLAPGLVKSLILYSATYNYYGQNKQKFD